MSRSTPKNLVLAYLIAVGAIYGCDEKPDDADTDIIACDEVFQKMYITPSHPDATSLCEAVRALSPDNAQATLAMAESSLNEVSTGAKASAVRLIIHAGRYEGVLNHVKELGAVMGEELEGPMFDALNAIPASEVTPVAEDFQHILQQFVSVSPEHRDWRKRAFLAVQKVTNFRREPVATLRTRLDGTPSVGKQAIMVARMGGEEVLAEYLEDLLKPQ